MKHSSAVLLALLAGSEAVAGGAVRRQVNKRDDLEVSPPSYPSPWMNPDADGWGDAYAKAAAFVSQLTLAEKVNITTGVGWEGEQCVGQTGSVPRLGLRSLCMQDSPTGVRDTDYNSAFTSGQLVAATFSRELMYQRGLAMGQEHKAKGVNVQLGPVAGPIGRAPEGGRNWEGFSPDPVLSGIGIAETIKGIQDAGVMACAKHYIGYEQEHFRQAGGGVDASYSSNIDDKTMHELYLWPFADAVRAGVASVMCSYNQVNNSYACHNSKMLNGLLKDELGFQGFVMSDWTGQLTGVASTLAGLDMTMPGDTAFNTGLSFWGPNLTISVLNGTVPEARIDDMAMRIMAGFFKTNQTLDLPPITYDSWTLDTYGPIHFAVGEGFQQINFHVDVRADHADGIREVGAKGTVLLKNNGVLPLNKPKFVAVIGEDAGDNLWGPNGCSDRGCDNGTLAMGWGSGTSNFPYLITPDQALQAQAVADGTVYQSIPASNQIAETKALVSQANVTAIVFVNADSGEGYITVDGNVGDRNNLTVWGEGDALIETVAGLCSNTIVVIHSVGAVLVTDWYNNPNISAILWAGLPGQESGNSLVDVLYGKVNPAGRLPFTIGASREDYGTDILYDANNGGEAPQIDFTEGVMIDYRYFDKYDTSVIYEFGYGLSYTTFEYSNLQVTKSCPGPYTPTNGTTAAAPVFGNFSTNPSDYLFPSDEFPFIRQYIYPYISSDDLATSSGDLHYGVPSSEWLPPDSNSTSPQPLLRSSGGNSPGGNAALYDVLYTITVDIANTGSLDGDEVPQLYVSLGAPSDPVLVLRNFDRLTIPAGQTGTWTTSLTRRDVSNWDPVIQDWFISNYTKTISVGKSSRNLVLNATLA